jgi:hypothetical protein
MGPTHQTHAADVADMLQSATVEKPRHLSGSQLQDPRSLGGRDPVRLWIVNVASPAVRPLSNGFRLTRSNRSAVKQLHRLLATAPEYMSGVEPRTSHGSNPYGAADDREVEAARLFRLGTQTSRRVPVP